MVFGRMKAELDDSGLLQMGEVTLAVTKSELRDIAYKLIEISDQIPDEPTQNWHRHIPDALANKIGCDVVVTYKM
ncbi:MAG: hypothetical protein GY880_07425 [Planctomycetaceae bacterium]|nr:hypothetical protein [Planctomycetaceae bacterium]MDB2526516.1 hypothetical protein [Mariniblastus sp.]